MGTKPPKPPARARTTSATAGNSRSESCGDSLARCRESLAIARIDSCGNSLARRRESLAVARIESCGNSAARSGNFFPVARIESCGDSAARRSGTSFAITGVREIELIRIFHKMQILSGGTATRTLSPTLCRCKSSLCKFCRRRAIELLAVNRTVYRVSVPI